MSPNNKSMDPLEPKLEEEVCDMPPKLAYAIELGRSLVHDKKRAKQLYKTGAKTRRYPKFPQFANFPAEIRHKIWKSAIPGPQLIDVRIDPIGFLVSQTTPGEDSNEETEEESDEESSPNKIIWGVTDISKDSQRLCDYANRYAVFEASPESRRESLSRNTSTCLSTRTPDIPTDKYFISPTQLCSRFKMHTPGIQFLKEKDTLLITQTRHMPSFLDFTEDPHLLGTEDILSIALPFAWGFNSLDLTQHSSYQNFILRIKSTFPNAQEVFLIHKEVDWYNLAGKNKAAGISVARQKGVRYETLQWAARLHHLVTGYLVEAARENTRWKKFEILGEDQLRGMDRWE